MPSTTKEADNSGISEISEVPLRINHRECDAVEQAQDEKYTVVKCFLLKQTNVIEQ